MYGIVYVENKIPKAYEKTFESKREAEDLAIEKGWEKFNVILLNSNPIDFSKGMFDTGTITN